MFRPAGVEGGASAAGADPDTLTGMVTKTATRTWPMPRIGSKRHPKRPTLGPLQAAIAGLMGVEMFPWQRHVGDVSLELVPRKKAGTKKRLAAGNVGVVAGRQSGKTAWIASRVALQCLLPELPQVATLVGADSVKILPQNVGVTAQDRINALARFEEHTALIMDSPLAAAVAKVTKKNGSEAIRFRNGSEYKVLTPSRTGARGAHLDLVVIDEALAHESWLMSVMRPTTAQRDGAVGCIGAQFVIVSNAGDDRSQLLNDQRELGRRAVATGDTKRVWLEWSAEDGADPYEERTWWKVLPTLEQTNGVSLDFVRSEAETLSLDDFSREYLCVYRPRREAFIIDPDLWHRLPPFAPAGDVVLAVDATRDRDAASVVAAGLAEDFLAVELVQQRPGVEWVGGYVEEVALRQGAPVVVDGYGPLSGIIPGLERAGVYVIKAKVGDVVDAAQGFVDLVTAGSLAHLPDPRFEIESVGRRRIGERWGFARTGEVDISPVVAASLACWGVANELASTPSIH